jgi:RNA polymerase sigma-70 factor (ECF subfamily)
MSEATDARELPLEAFRDYLRMLANVQIGPRLQTKVDASDIVQQTLLEALKCQRQFRGQSEGELTAWLRAILANVLAASARRYSAGARDLARERSLHAEVELSSSRLEILLSADQTSPSERTVLSEDLLRLARALAGLPPDARQVIEMHHLQGLTLSEAAEFMGRSRPAVAGLLFRGIKRLRELLADNSEAPDESQLG